MKTQLSKRARATARTALALLIAFAGAAQAEPVGYVAGIQGSVEISSGSGSWAAAVTDSSVELGDVLRTGSDSSAKVVLLDDTILSIGEETEIAVDTMVAGSTAVGSGEPSVLRMLSGKVRARVGEAFGGPSRLEIHTRTAVVGVKGTDFEVHDTCPAGAVASGTVCTFVCTWEGRVFTRSIDMGVAGEEDVVAGDSRAIEQGRGPGPASPIPHDFCNVGPGPSSGVKAAAGLVRKAGGDKALAQLLLDTPPVAAGGDDDLDLILDPEPESDFDSIQAGGDDIFDDLFDEPEVDEPEVDDPDDPPDDDDDGPLGDPFDPTRPGPGDPDDPTSPGPGEGSP